MANDNQQTKTKYATFSVLFFFVICSLTMIVVEADEGGHIEQQEQEEESPQIGLSSAALTNGVGLERVVKEENEAEEEVCFWREI
jgi:hypothetical protein